MAAPAAAAKAPKELWPDSLRRVAAEFAAGTRGRALTQICSNEADALLRAAFASAPPPVNVALVAVGAHGRGELCPFSDLDLWIVLPDGVAATTLDPFLHQLLYPLWDAKIQVGHAVRTARELVELARTDLATYTALLDMRFVAGDADLFTALVGEADALFAAEHDAFLRMLHKEISTRHARFGDTMFLLEPNVKNGEGGYRDLLVGLWAVRARFRIDSFSDLVALGEIGARQAAVLDQALDFFLTLRTCLQLTANRKNDRLTFEAQERISAQLFADHVETTKRGPDGELIRPAVTPAVEALMQTYFRHATDVKREVRRILDRNAAAPPKRPAIKPLDASFAIFDGRLTVRDPAVLVDSPSEIVRIFNVALDTGAELFGHTRDLIADQASRVDLSRDARAGAEFLRLLTDARDARIPSLLEEAHDLGVLNSLLPEFAPCTNRVQHDLYHVFTVDQHSLYAVARLKSLERGELRDTLPVATDAFADVKRRAPLYLGTLLHDVGKPLGKGHSESGAKLARRIAERLGFSADDVHQTEFLVRKHLLLSHLSQRRDLNDVAMVANLAHELTDEETLRELYLLTLADMSMVAPDNLTEWKERLLRELFAKTESYFRRGPDPLGQDRSELVVSRRARTAELLGETVDALAEWFASLPDGYVASTQPKDIAAHVRLTRRFSGDVAIEVTQRPRSNHTDVTILSLDRPGLLADLTGVLWAHRIDVLGAQIHSRPGQALDVFTVRDRYGKPITDEKRWQIIESDFGRVQRGEVTVGTLLQERADASGLPPRVLPPVETEIAVDNEVSTDYSVVDVATFDRPGVLYTITRTLSQLELDIQLSKVATEAAKVTDVFYVRTRSGNKLERDEIARLRAELLAALAALP